MSRCIMLVVILLLPTVTIAGTFLVPYKSPGFEFRVNGGYMTGVATEEVYDADGSVSGIRGYKLSQLDWRIDRVKLLGIGVSVIPVNRIRLNVDYLRNYESASGTMTDYDWLYIGSDWSNRSYHPDTTVTKIDTIDVNGEFLLQKFWPRRSSSVMLSALIGYKRNQVAWQARGGSGVYSVSSFRDTPLTFQNKPIISYQQRFTVPYVGLKLSAMSTILYGRYVKIDMNVRYSNLVYGEDVDVHHFSNMRFEDEAHGGTWNLYSVKLTLELWNDFSANLGYVTESYKVGGASTRTTNLFTGNNTLYSGPYAGLSHRSNKLFFGVIYRY